MSYVLKDRTGDYTVNVTLWDFGIVVDISDLQKKAFKFRCKKNAKQVLAAIMDDESGWHLVRLVPKRKRSQKGCDCGSC